MKKLGKYAVEARIGVGGMGTIYRAFDPYFERAVAIKVMSAQFAADEEFRARFFREARSTARLHHPNIVSVYDLGEEGGIPYLVMEYLEDQDLRSMISGDAPISLEQQVGIMVC
jgi:eukaryotic-like serine/threonine-protein kinase